MLKKIVKKISPSKHKIEGYRYQIDQANEQTIDGWACKTGDTEHRCDIQIRNDNIILYACKADTFRRDLKDAEIGDGKHAFNINTAQLVLEKDIDYIDVFIDGHKANEKPIPLVLKMAELANLAPKPKPVAAVKPAKPLAKNTDFQMYIDGASSTKVFGWVKRKDSVTHRCKVELRVGNTVLGADTADEFRQSIKNAKIGDGCYCFNISPLIHLFPQAKIQCDLYADNVKITSKAITIEVDPNTLEKAKFEHEFSSELSSFNQAVSKELERISSEINEDGTNTMQVAMNNIATLSARVDVIERVLTKYFSSNK